MTLTEKALKFATEAHGSIGQKRKYGGDDYIVHPTRVAAIVESVTNDEEMIAAAFLHDVIEDVTPHKPDVYNLDVIEKEFGTRVTLLVHELTNEYSKEKYPKFNRRERKRLENLRVRAMSNDAKTIKLADIIDNNGDMDKATDDFAEVYRVEKLVQWEYLKGGDETLFKKAYTLLTK